MRPATTLNLDNAGLAEVSARVAELDPDARYEVIIRRARTREEIAADLDRLSRTVSARARAEGLSDEEFAEMLGMDEAERRNLLG